MYQSYKIFSSVAATAKDLEGYTSAELVKMYRESDSGYKDDRIVALLAKRVYGMTMQRAVRGRNFNSAEGFEDAYMHALVYSINHFNIYGNSKFESFYRMCLYSTVASMYARTNTLIGRLLYNATSVDECDYCIADESQTVETDELKCGWIKELLPLRDDEGKILVENYYARKLVDAIMQSNAALKDKELCLEMELVTYKEKSFGKRSDAVKEFRKLVSEHKDSRELNGALKEVGIIYDIKLLDKVRTLVRDSLTPYKEELMCL